MGYIARRSRRFFPRSSVTVALLDKDRTIAYGVVKDISEAGACVITDKPLAKNRDVILRMSFYQTGMLAAGGRVVWAEVTEALGGARHGVEFTDVATAERKKLRKILDSTAFGVAAG